MPKPLRSALTRRRENKGRRHNQEIGIITVLVGQSHSQAVVACALLPQLADDFDGRLTADIEEGYAEAVIDLVGKVRRYIQLGCPCESTALILAPSTRAPEGR